MTFDFERKRPLVHTGNNLKPFLKELNKKEAEVSVNADPDELNGTIANTGKVRGSARIIIGRQDFHKFKNKDILVTAMTSVDFVPLMERASAFVTNEGGITSHASIVSRELNKPCLIGTRIATQILKDGDFIEVDAFKGVVRILKRKR
jgi:pyruvate,water dikinase